MIRVRLFSRDDPSRQIDSRLIGDEDVRVGRGTTADWVVQDAERTLSRLHLVLRGRAGRLTVTDTSTNGVFLGGHRERVERDRATPVSLGEPIQFGGYLLLAEDEVRDDRGVDEPVHVSSPSPFIGSPNADKEAASPARARNPFGSALKSDPVAIDHEPVEVDAWERRREFEAGDWQAVAPHRRPDHSEMIGTPQDWKQPPAEPVEHGLGFDAPFSGPILREPAAVPPGGLHIPSDWDVPAGDPAGEAPAPDARPASVADPDPILPPPAAVQVSAPMPVPVPVTPGAAFVAKDDGLFDAFCRGARLSPDAFAGEDRVEMMERLGAVYRQAILGIADLMGERTALKNDFRMVRTVIRAEGNNPFKWVPPQRIAVELLKDEDGSGYVTGEPALNEALHDVKAHILCMLAGMRAALSSTFDLLSPSEIEGRIAARSFVMPGQKNAAAWSEYAELFATLRREADDSAEGPINRAFREAYEAQATQLDGRSGR